MNLEKSVAEVSGNDKRLKREKSSKKARRIKPANSVEKMRHSKRDESAEKIRQLKQDMSLPLQSIQLTNNLGGIVDATFCDHFVMKKN
jgi:hypothetical protein